MNLGIAILIKKRAKNSSHVLFENQIFLIDAFQQLAAQAVNRLTLLVHHVVILKQVFASFEVLAFDCLLRLFDSPCDQAGFDRNSLFHSEPLQ